MTNHHTQRDRRRNRRVDGIATRFQRCHAGVRRNRLHTGDHAVGRGGGIGKPRLCEDKTD